MSYQIIETKTNKSLTGSFFRVYINGFCDGRIFTTLEAAKNFAENQKKVYRRS